MTATSFTSPTPPASCADRVALNRRLLRSSNRYDIRLAETNRQLKSWNEALGLGSPPDILSDPRARGISSGVDTYVEPEAPFGGSNDSFKVDY